MINIELFFDYLSPYSYLCWTQVREHIVKLQSFGEVTLTPVILSQVIHANDTKGPAEIKSKRDYLMKDCLRYSVKNKVAFSIPKTLPFNSLDALRLSQKCIQQASQIPFIDACFRYAWELGQDLGEYDELIDYLRSKNLDPTEKLELVPMQELRRELKTQVKRAIELEAFGLPTFIIHHNEQQELFWGNDSFSAVLEYLDGNDPMASHMAMKKYNDYLTKF